MIERQTMIQTPSGDMGLFMCHPDGAGPYPVILFYMDAPGIREELRDMARRLAGMGYYVLLPNLYYRAGVEELGAFIGAANAATRERMFGFMNSLTIPMVMDDTDALLAFAAKDAAASPGPVGCVGYCMSGQYAISAAVRHPDRVTAAASIYGTRLITDQPDSPHLTAPRAAAEIYVAWAEIDHYAPLEMLAPLQAAFREGGVRGDIELYAGVEHGFAFPERPAYDRDAAERHWDRLTTLFARNLPHPA